MYIAFVNGIGTNGSQRTESLSPLAFTSRANDTASVTIAAAATIPTVAAGFTISMSISMPIPLPFLIGNSIP